MLIKIFCFAVLAFAGILAFLIGMRIDKDTVSLFSGTLIGIIVTTPSASLITYILMRRSEEEKSRRDAMDWREVKQNRVPLYWVLPPMTHVETQPIAIGLRAEVDRRALEDGR